MHSGHIIQVTCFVSEGDLPLTIEWLFNAESVDKHSDIAVVKVGKRSSILSIESVTYEHAANYTCLARNAAGASSFTAQLQVNGYHSIIHVIILLY